MTNEEIWACVKRVVKKRGKKLKDVAEASGIPYKTLTNWRTRNILPNVSQARAMAIAVGCSVEELFFADGTEPSFLDLTIE